MSAWRKSVLAVRLLDMRPLCIPPQSVPVTKAQESGRWHEYKMHLEFERVYGEWYLPSPWFNFRTHYGWRYCQADGLLFMPDGRLIICEAKLQHTPKAFKQLSTIYRPVVESLFPRWDVCLLEVVRWYKSDVLGGFEYPMPMRLVQRPEEVSPQAYCVMVLKDTRPSHEGGGGQLKNGGGNGTVEEHKSGDASQ